MGNADFVTIKDKIEVERPYRLVIGDVAKELLGKFNEHVSRYYAGCPTIEGKLSLNSQGVLVGSTPHARGVLGKEVLIGDLAKKLGISVATPSELAQMYNDEKERFEMHHQDSSIKPFIKGRFWFDAGIWLVNPSFDFSKVNDEANIWNYQFAAETLARVGRGKVLAVPDEAVTYLPQGRRAPAMYVQPGKEHLVTSLDWKSEDVTGRFEFYVFDSKTGVPKKGSTGGLMSKMYPLRKDVPVSALCVDYGLSASGNRDFGDSDEYARVVFSVGEAKRA